MPGSTYKKIVVANDYYAWYRIVGTDVWGIREDDNWSVFKTTSSYLPAGATTATQSEYETALDNLMDNFTTGGHVPHKPPA